MGHSAGGVVPWRALHGQKWPPWIRHWDGQPRSQEDAPDVQDHLPAGNYLNFLNPLFGAPENNDALNSEQINGSWKVRIRHYQRPVWRIREAAHPSHGQNWVPVRGETPTSVPRTGLRSPSRPTQLRGRAGGGCFRTKPGLAAPARGRVLLEDTSEPRRSLLAASRATWSGRCRGPSRTTTGRKPEWAGHWRSQPGPKPVNPFINPPGLIRSILVESPPRENRIPNAQFNPV